MENLREVAGHSREGESNNPVYEKRGSTYLDDPQRSGLRAHLESDGLVDSDNDPGLGQPEGGWEEDGNRKRNTQQRADGKNPTADENFQDQFYRGYREVAEEYDKEFLKKYNEDLNTTLIFAGLFSAVASAFIIEVNSELKPHPNDETAALLRVLIHKIDNTTFGTDVPPLPQSWTGPPDAIVQVQAVLFASLAASLLSALLAVLGKQWLSRYDWADVKGTTIERAQNRQRKLDGIDAWHFYYVMEALPLMLQVALLLLGCALSRYLWEVNIVVASVVLSVTSLGMAFYLSIIVAGTADESCPYQTPFVNILHQVLRLFGIPSQLHATDQQQTKLDLRCISWVLRTSLDKRIHRLAFNYLRTIPELPPHVEPTFVSDCFNVFLECINVNKDKVVIVEESEQFVTAVATGFLRASYQLLATDPASSAAVDLRRNCRKHFKLHPGANFEGHPFRYTMIAIHALISEDQNLHYISWDGNRPPVLEHMFFTQYALKRAQERYEQSQHTKVPRWTLHFVSYSISLDPPPPSFVVANCLKIIAIDLDCDISCVTTSEEGAQVEKVLSVEAESFFNAEAEKIWSAQVVKISGLIAQKLETMVGTNDPDLRLISSKSKAIGTLLPHAVFLRQRQLGRMTTEIPHIGSATQTAEPSWCYASPFVAAPPDGQSSHLLDRVVLLASARIPFSSQFWGGGGVSKWNAIALNVLKDAGERAVSDMVVSQTMANMLLQLASHQALRPQILAETWVWLKNPLALPVLSRGREEGTTRGIVRHIRGLGDIEILKSYFLLVWSEWDHLKDGGFHEMGISIREDFGGVERWRDREELIERLDQVLWQLSLGPAHLNQHLPPGGWIRHDIGTAISQYSSLRDTLLDVHEVHENALLREGILPRYPSMRNDAWAPRAYGEQSSANITMNQARSRFLDANETGRIPPPGCSGGWNGPHASNSNVSSRTCIAPSPSPNDPDRPISPTYQQQPPFPQHVGSPTPHSSCTAHGSLSAPHPLPPERDYSDDDEPPFDEGPPRMNNSLWTRPARSQPLHPWYPDSGIASFPLTSQNPSPTQFRFIPFVPGDDCVGNDDDDGHDDQDGDGDSDGNASRRRRD